MNAFQLSARNFNEIFHLVDTICQLARPCSIILLAHIPRFERILLFSISLEIYGTVGPNLRAI